MRLLIFAVAVFAAGCGMRTVSTIPGPTAAPSTEVAEVKALPTKPEATHTDFGVKPSGAVVTPEPSESVSWDQVAKSFSLIQENREIAARAAAKVQLARRPEQAELEFTIGLPHEKRTRS